MSDMTLNNEADFRLSCGKKDYETSTLASSISARNTPDIFPIDDDTGGVSGRLRSEEWIRKFTSEPMAENTPEPEWYLWKCTVRTITPDDVGDIVRHLRTDEVYASRFAFAHVLIKLSRMLMTPRMS